MKPLTVSLTSLRRLYELPAYADEATIRAAMRCAPPLSKTQAAAKVRGTVRPASSVVAGGPSRLSAGSIAAASDAELRHLSATPPSAADRKAIDDEIVDRQFMANHFPGAAPSNGRARIHSYS